MIKKFALLALAAAAATAGTTSAHAQSSVTLFGIVDAAARQVKNGGNDLLSLSSGGINTSRLGVRGTEDLGGGLRAGFWLEHGFNVDTGIQSDATRFWNRRATVSLSGGFGELRLGRDFTPTYLGYADFDPFGDNGLAASSKFNNALGTNVDTLTRADNLIAYFLPQGIGGLYGQVTVGAGEGVTGKKYLGGRLGYGAGPVNVSVAYAETDVAPQLGQDKHKVGDVGLSYDAGVVKVTAYYINDKFAARKQDTYALGVLVPIGLGTLKVGYTHVDAKGNTPQGVSVAGNDADQAAVGYVYNLSKRTALYGTVAYIDNKGSATYALASQPAITAGQKSKGYELGIRHAF